MKSYRGFKAELYGERAGSYLIRGFLVDENDELKRPGVSFCCHVSEIESEFKKAVDQYWEAA